MRTMTLADYLPFIGTDDEARDGLAELQAILSERQTTLELTAQYGRPSVDTQGEPTAVFPYVVYHEGAPYAEGCKEFVIPDDGLQDSEAALTGFLSQYSIGTVADIGSIEGAEANATLNDAGDIEVYA